MKNQLSLSINETPTHRWVEWVDRVILISGQGIAWLSLPLIGIIVLQVILRYGFSSGLVAFEELQWHLYAVLVMFAVAYGVTEDIHIRMDLLYQNRSIKTKAWIDLFGLCLFALPVALVLCIYGMDLVEASFKVRETSASPGGLPLRWVIKSVLPVSMGLYVIAILSRIARIVIFIFRKQED